MHRFTVVSDRFPNDNRLSAVAELERRVLRGWEVLELSSEAITVTVIPGLGGALWSLTRRADAAELIWTPPWGIPPHGTPGLPTDAGAAAVTTRGGWQTLFPNAATRSASTVWNGGSTARHA